MPAATASIAALLLALGAGGTLAAEPAALRLPLGEQMRMTYTPRPWSPDLQSPAELAHAPPRAALGLEFATAPKDGGARSLLRLQLSADSALNFRPRGGGLHVTYRSRF